jgi:hypothetical protein
MKRMMNQKLLLLGIIVMSLLSCEKVYTCACTDSPTSSVIKMNTINAKSSAGAEEQCKVMENTGEKDCWILKED